jgi:hypothetical protein
LSREGGKKTKENSLFNGCSCVTEISSTPFAITEAPMIGGKLNLMKTAGNFIVQKKKKKKKVFFLQILS